MNAGHNMNTNTNANTNTDTNTMSHTNATNVITIDTNTITTMNTSTTKNTNTSRILRATVGPSRNLRPTGSPSASHAETAASQQLMAAVKLDFGQEQYWPDIVMTGNTTGMLLLVLILTLT